MKFSQSISLVSPLPPLISKCGCKPQILLVFTADINALELGLFVLHKDSITCQ